MLKDQQWERMQPHLPGKSSDPGRTGADNRLFVEAVLWLARTGVPWRDLPPCFGNWNSVFIRFSRWSKDGGHKPDHSPKGWLDHVGLWLKHQGFMS